MSQQGGLGAGRLGSWMELPWPGEGAGYGEGQGKLLALSVGKEPCPVPQTHGCHFPHPLWVLAIEWMDGVQVGFAPGGPGGKG